MYRMASNIHLYSKEICGSKPVSVRFNALSLAFYWGRAAVFIVAVSQLLLPKKIVVDLQREARNSRRFSAVTHPLPLVPASGTSDRASPALVLFRSLEH